jgi:uncharacterized protein YbaP (TraB family)
MGNSDLARGERRPTRAPSWPLPWRTVRRMVRHFVDRVAIVLLVAGLLGSAPVHAAPDLWVVSKGEASVVLYGSLHFSGPERNWRTPSFVRALATADSLWLESVPAPASDALRTRIAAATMDPTRSLKARLAVEDQQRLEVIAARLGVPEAALDHMRPWSASLVLVERALRRAGLKPGGAEADVAGEGLARNVPVTGLEPAERTPALVSSLTDAEDLAVLTSTLRDLERPDPQFLRLQAAWEAGDEAAIEAIGIGEMRRDTPALYRLLIADRNKDWAERIGDLLVGRGRHFVSLGILHLVGPDRLQLVLEAQGYTVQRAPNR